MLYPRQENDKYIECSFDYYYDKGYIWVRILRGEIVSKTSSVENFPFFVKATRQQHSLVIIQRSSLLELSERIP